jgi:putative PIN family toxin of toxin-antitoxin system
MIEVVLDTNVLVAALRSSLGASYRLLQSLEGKLWRPVISPALALEYEAVLKRDAPKFGLTLGDIDDFVEYLCSQANLVQVYYRWRPALRDPNDDRILEVAVRMQAAIVTFNLKDFAEVERFGIRAIRPKGLLALMGDVR